MGCGKKGQCDNQFCATGSGRPVPPNAAAAKALILARQRSPLCVPPSKVPNSNSKTQLTNNSYSRNHMSSHDTNSNAHSGPPEGDRQREGEGDEGGGNVSGSARATPIQADVNSTHRHVLNSHFSSLTNSSSSATASTSQDVVEPMDTASPPPPPPPSSSASSVQQSSSSSSSAAQQPIAETIAAALIEFAKNPKPGRYNYMNIIIQSCITMCAYVQQGYAFGCVSLCMYVLCVYYVCQQKQVV